MTAILRIAAALALCAAAGPAPAAAIDKVFAGEPLSIDERAGLICPPPGTGGPFARPTRENPSPAMPIWVDFSSDSDVVRLSGPETERLASLGVGDDVALLYDIGAGMVLNAGEGSDTILVCGMDDISAAINVGFIGGDNDRDVVVIESAVFADVPPGLRREIGIHDFDPQFDILVIRVPAKLAPSIESSADVGGFRVGNVDIKVRQPALRVRQPTFREQAFRIVPVPD